MPGQLSEFQKAELRIRSAEIAIKYGTKVGIERDACLEQAKKIYEFAIGTTEEKPPAPAENSSTG